MLAHWIWYAALQGISLRQKRQLLEHFSDPEELYYAEDIQEISGISFAVAQALEDKDLTKAQQIIKQCARLNVHILTYRDAAYPERLKQIDDSPLVLYYRGILPDFDMQPVIGVVGTRKASTYGKINALEMSRSIAACGGLVVSGGAAGIDTEALKGAMEADASVVAVLGCGVDVAFPASNRALFQKIEEKGCLISEYPPGTAARAWRFPERNRIISGLSNGVLVVEAPEKSGALITARDALEQGRDIFVVPGNINVSTCAGSNALLNDGAAAIFSGWDVMKHYTSRYPNVQQRQLPSREDSFLRVAEPVWLSLPSSGDKKYVDNPIPSAYSDQGSAASNEDDLSWKLLSCLDTEPVSVDDVIARAQEPAADVLSALTKMALLGMVVNHPGRMVSAKRK